jgi:hypothetical protein
MGNLFLFFLLVIVVGPFVGYGVGNLIERIAVPFPWPDACWGCRKDNCNSCMIDF